MKKDSSIRKNHTGIDSETIKGKVVLICSPKRSLFLPKTFEEIASFLFTVKANEAHHMWTFNLNYDVTAILKFLPYDILMELYFGKENEPDTKNKVVYGGYKIVFIPNKFFSIAKGHNKCTLVDAAQFFNTSLDKASESYLNEKKMSSIVIEDFKNQSDILDNNGIIIKKGHTPDYLMTSLLNNKELLIKYCMHDAYLTSKLGEKIDDGCYEIYHFRLETYTSNAKIGEKATLNYLEDEFIKKGLPVEYHSDKTNKMEKSNLFPQIYPNSISCLYAKDSYRGGIFETWQRGIFKNIIDIDINSAYPFNMINLPHWANGKFIELNAKLIYDITNNNIKYKYGWVACKFDCPYIPFKIDISGVFDYTINNDKVEAKTQKGLTYYPNGEREQIITLAEYYFMRKYNFKIEILSGYIWEQDKDLYPNPFLWIKDIYETKTKIKHSGIDTKRDMNYLMCKIGMNGAYGKTVQKIGELALRPLFNPFYASYITALCRIQIASFILDNKLEKDVLSIATDGILLKNKHDLSKCEGENIGEYEINKYEKVLLIGNGMLQLINGDKINTRMRGITENHKFDILQQLIEHGKENTYKNFKSRPLHLGESLLHSHKYPKEENLLNCFVSFGRELKINADKKRKWKQLDNFNQLLNSQIKGKRYTVKELVKIESNDKEV
jgi:hypothetical protein